MQPRAKQLVDWSAAFWAGVGAWVLFMAASLLWVPKVIGVNPWVVIRLFASSVMGEDVLAPPAAAHTTALITALAVTLGACILFAMLIAFVLHRGGLVTGLLGGAAFGVVGYIFDVHIATLFFPWFLFMKHGAFLASYVLLGAASGGIYEILEHDYDGADAEVHL